MYVRQVGQSDWFFKNEEEVAATDVAATALKTGTEAAVSTDTGKVADQVAASVDTSVTPTASMAVASDPNKMLMMVGGVALALLALKLLMKPKSASQRKRRR